MTTDNTIAISVTKTFTASPERVFDAWLDPAMVDDWFAPGLGRMTRVDIDPRPGGAFYLDQQRDRGIAKHWGQYLEITRPHRLVFTWCVEGVDSEDTVSIDVTANGTGCSVTVTHRIDAAFERYADLTRQGWTLMLDGMAKGLALQARQEKSLVVERRFVASPEQVFAAWTTASLARQWLFAPTDISTGGYNLDVRPGGRWTIIGESGDTLYTVSGKYLTVKPPHRLEFTIGMPQLNDNSDQVSVLCEPDGDGCRMTLVQEGADIARELNRVPSGQRGASESGWQEMFNNLAGALARDTGHAAMTAPDTLRFERLLSGSRDRIWTWLTDSEKRGQWLASGVMPATAGNAFTLRFDHASLSPNKAPAPERFKPYEGGIDSRHILTLFEPPHRFAMSWGGGEEPESEVSFELVEEGDHVRLILIHSGLQKGEEMLGTAGGWHTHLAILENRLADITPPSFWTLFAGIEADYKWRLNRF